MVSDQVGGAAGSSGITPALTDADCCQIDCSAALPEMPLVGIEPRLVGGLAGCEVVVGARGAVRPSSTPDKSSSAAMEPESRLLDEVLYAGACW